MNAVLLSVRPKYCELIASGQKTIEVRRTKPKLETPFKVYIYCTKVVGNHLVVIGDKPSMRHAGMLVIGEFVCDKIITVDCDSVAPFDPETHEYIQDATCLDRTAFIRYTNFRKAFGWHISELKIYEMPKALNDFYMPCRKVNCKRCAYFYMQDTTDGFELWCTIDEKIPIVRPPQSYMYVEER